MLSPRLAVLGLAGLLGSAAMAGCNSPKEATTVKTSIGSEPKRNSTSAPSSPLPSGREPMAAPVATPPANPEADELREALVRGLSREIRDPRVLDAMRRVPRHLFAPNLPLYAAYADRAMPIGYDQTISQPTVVAIMTEALELDGDDRVLEIGTGSGYQAAILALLSKEVFTIEIVPELGEMSRKRLAELGYANVTVRVGDGYLGWPEHAPFDRVIITAAPPELPRALVDQLAMGGILVAPIGASPYEQRLMRYRKTTRGLKVEDLGGVAFVPMVPGDAR